MPLRKLITWLVLFLVGLSASLFAQQEIHILGLHAPQIVQKTGNVTASGTTVTATLTPTPTNSSTAGTGTTLIGMCGVNNTGTISISDGNSNTWTTAKSQTGTVAGSLISFVPNPNSGSTTVTCTAGTTGVVTVSLYEVYGFLTLVDAQPDVTDSNTGASQTTATLSAAGLSPLHGNEIAFANLVLTTNNACTASTGWTIDTQQGATGGRMCPTRQNIPDGANIAGSNAVATFTSASYALAAATFMPTQLPIEGTVKLWDGTTLIKVINSTNAMKTDLSSVAGTATDVNSGTKSNGTQRVVLATDQPQLTNKLLVTPDSDIETVPVATATTTNTALRCTLVSAASTNATNCKASAGNIYGFRFVNTTTTVYYLRLYNLTTAPTCSSATGFIESIPIPPAGASGQAGGIVAIEAFGEGYSTGIGFCFTGGSSSTDATNAATGVFGTILYK